MRWPYVRDIALFFGGMAGVLHETLLSKAERPTLLIMFAAMMGLPTFLQPGEGGPTRKPNRLSREERLEIEEAIEEARRKKERDQ